jgi:hypothetical protein
MAKKQKSSAYFWAFISIVIVSVMGIVFLLIKFDKQKPDYRGCLENNSVNYVELSVLIDATEPISAAQLEKASSYVQEQVENLGAYDRVRIFAMSETSGVSLKPSFDFCKPDPDSFDAPTKKRFESLRFKHLIEREIRKNEGVQTISPIIRSVGSVASQFKSQKGTKEVIIISDLIENSETLSMYERNWMKLSESDRVNKSRPMLDDIEIQILWLMRPTEDRQTVEIREWWAKYLQKSGGYVSTIIPMTGN